MVKSTILFTLVSLLSVGTSHAGLASNKAFVPKQKQHEKLLKKHNVLDIRGGAGPLDPMTTAKVATVVILAQGVLMSEAPSFTNEQYGLKSDTVTDFMMRGFGTGVLSLFTFFYCILLQDASFATAFQICEIPWILNSLGNVLNKSASASGFDDRGQAFLLVLTSFMTWAAAQDWGMDAIKVFSAFWLLNGLFMAVKPTDSANMWGNGKLNLGSLALVRPFGFYLIATSVVMLAMVAYDKDALTAFGYSELVWFANHVVTLFLTKEAMDAGIDRTSMYVWMVAHGIVAGTILL